MINHNDSDNDYEWLRKGSFKKETEALKAHGQPVRVFR